MRRYLCAIGAAACVMAFGGARAAAPAPTAKPAIWRTYDMIVDLHDLPHTYTCDQLWYEFHGILLHLGAPPAGVNILPYDCSPSPSGDMKSPHVEVRFQLPFVLQPGVTGAPIEAVERAVRLSPGEPTTLKASDCHLLHQITQTLFASLPVKVGATHFDCSAPPPRAGRFAVTLRVPVVASAPTAGANRSRPPNAGRALH